MILVAAGTQLPFARLFDAVEAIAADLNDTIIAQTADPARTSAVMQCIDRLPPARFDDLVRECDVLVGHAGIGVIIAAATHRKPLILMPRRAALGEHRNDHQLATAERFRDRPGVCVVDDAGGLRAALLRRDPPAFSFAGSAPREALVAAVRAAILG